MAPKIVQAAVRLAGLGFAVHWLRGPKGGQEQGRGKAPVAKAWQKAPWTPPEQVAQGYRPGCNLGIHTGLVEGCPRPVVVVDLDSAEALVWAKLHLPATPIRTTTAAGEHWYYTHPGGGAVLPNRVHAGGRKIDVRGDGGNVVVAPSRHPSGRAYREASPWDADAVQALPTFDPGWFAEAPAPMPAPRRAARAGDHQHLVKRARAWLAKLPPAISGQGGHQATWEAALGLVRGFGLGADDALDLLLQDFNPRCTPAWSEKELRHKVDSAARQAHVPEGYLRDAERPGSGRAAKLAPLPAWEDVPLEVRERDEPPPRRRGRAEQEQEQQQEQQQRQEQQDPAGPPAGDEVPLEVREQDAQGGGGWIFERGSEVEIARALQAELERGRLVAYGNGEVLAYLEQQGIWQLVTHDELVGVTKGLDGAQVGSGKGARALSLSHGKIKGSIAILVAHLRHRYQGFLDAAPAGVAVQNGFILVGPGGAELRPHSPDHRSTTLLPVPFDPVAQAPRFERFLHEVFPVYGGGDDFLHQVQDACHKRMFLQEFVGACLFGVATRYEVCAFLTGTGANGKSQFIRIVEALFPPGAVTSVTPQRFADLRHRAQLAGARINLVSEVPEHDLLDTEGLKALVSGDEVTAEPKFRDPFRFKPNAGHLFAANKLPSTTDTTQGLWRKVEVIAFTASFDESPAREEEVSEGIIANELPGILAWAVQGAVRLLQQRRYTRVESSVQLKAEWRRESNSVALFAAECLDKTDFEEYRLRSSEVYTEYRKWSQAFGYRTQSQVKFSKGLVALGFERRELKTGTHFAVAVKSQDRPDPTFSARW